jgi:hypothetical protein
MTDELQNNSKPALLRAGLLLFLIAFGLRIFQAAIGDAPIAAAADATRTVSAPATVMANPSQPLPSTAIAYARVEWLTACGLPQPELGLYAPADAPCQPTRLVSLNWLQSQLAASGFLASSEYLEPTAQPGCLAAILDANARPAGYLCADANGLYRADLNGRAPEARFQLWMQGS